MSRFRTRAAAVVVAVLAMVAVATPAFAHDELVASSPASGEVLDVAPEQIELTFSADIMELGAAVIVADADENDWVGADPAIDLQTLTVPLVEGMPDGSYEVRWRVVSADGHPISGVIPFTVGEATAATDAATTDGHTEEDTTTTDDESSAAVMIIVIGGVIALAAIALVLFFLLRGRAQRTRTDADDASDES
ncbi:hypothetical protein GCM10009808_16130 [Microbacterium sediminicola]|uniref:CopC domain-containing protein n=1 Tax=Microbacterium sediminicola TaxID=415210 RepID=A0ABP4U8X2_9MICO